MEKEKWREREEAYAQKWAGYKDREMLEGETPTREAMCPELDGV